MPTIRQRLTSAWRSLRFPGGGALAGPYGLWPLMFPTTTDYQTTITDLPMSSAVMACVQWIMRTAPESRMVVRAENDAGEDTTIPRHPLVALVKNPNPWYDGDLLVQATAASYNLTGNAYWLMMRDGSGAVRELWWEPPFTIRPVIPADGSDFIAKYEVMRDNKWGTTVDARDVVHIRFSMDGSNPRMGVPPLQSALSEIFTDEEATRYTSALLANTAIPSVVISPSTPDARVSDDQLEQIKNTYYERFSGAQRGMPLVMRGPTKIDVLTFNPQQMDVRNLRYVSEERISGLLGVPAIVAGLGTGLARSTFSNYAEAREAAWEDCVIPMQRRFAAALTTQLLPNFAPSEGEYVGYDYSTIRVLQDDQNKLYTRLTTGYRGGWMTRADARRMSGLALDAADDVYITDLAPAEQGMTRVTAQTTSLPAPAGASLMAHLIPFDTAVAKARVIDAGGTGGTGKQWERWNAGRRAAHLVKLRTRIVDDPEHKSLRSDLDDVIASAETGFAADLTKAFAALGREAATAMPVEKSLTDDADVAATNAVDATLPIFREAFESAYAEVTDETIAAIARALDLPASQLTRNDLMRGLRSTQVARFDAFVADVNTQTAEAIIAAVQDGTAAGANPRVIARTIRQYVSGSHLYPGIAAERGDAAATAYRATVIARTESAVGRNLATVVAYESSEIVVGVKVFDGDGCGWKTHDDPRAANGLVVSFDDARETPVSHPQCVRAFAPELDANP